MSRRLVSFNGPSTPTKSPVQLKHSKNSPSPTSGSPARSAETPFHRKVRSLLQELRVITYTWDELVKMDGLKAVTNLTDARTELENALRLFPEGSRPHARIVSPKIAIMEECLIDLDQVILRLKKQFSKMNAIMDSLEEVMYEVHRLKGWKWIQSEPFWCTWTLEKFVTKLPSLLPPYHRSLQLQIELRDSLRSHSLTFEESRVLISKWVAQPYLEADEWVQEWEDLCEQEVDRWHAK